METGHYYHYTPVNSGYCTLNSFWVLQSVSFAFVQIVYAPVKKVLRRENKYKTINTNEEKVYMRLETDQFQVADIPLKCWCEK